MYKIDIDFFLLIYTIFHKTYRMCDLYIQRKEKIKQEFIIWNKIKKKKNKETRYLTFDAINTSLAMLKHSNTISKPLIPTKCHKFPLSLTRGKKGNRRSNPSHAITTFHPRRSNHSFPKQSFLSPHTHTQKKRRCEKKGIRDKVSQEANDNDTQPP